MVTPNPSATHNLADPRYQNCTTCHDQDSRFQRQPKCSSDEEGRATPPPSGPWRVALTLKLPSAPNPDPVGIPRGENVDGYNIRQSFEFGYRWQTVGGDDGMYRSTVNYGNGPRLLSSSLSINSLEGHGAWFDQIQLDTLGLGGDPYAMSRLRVEKNGLYRYDMVWRSDAYFNPSLTISYGEHAMDTVRHLQDHDLILFPQSSFKLFLGYSSDNQVGPSLTTEQLFDSRGDEYPLFQYVKRSQHEYRLGGEARFMGFRLNVLHGWVDFKDDTPVYLPSPSPREQLYRI